MAKLQKENSNSSPWAKCSELAYNQTIFDIVGTSVRQQQSPFEKGEETVYTFEIEQYPDAERAKFDVRSSDYWDSRYEEIKTIVDRGDVVENYTLEQRSFTPKGSNLEIKFYRLADADETDEADENHPF